MIVLKGRLDWDLQKIGLKAGDKINTHTTPRKISGAIFFDASHNGFKCECVVYPDNYDLVEKGGMR